MDAPAGGIAADSLAPLRMGELLSSRAEAVRVAAEPGGAAALAALLSRRYQPAAQERPGVLVCGGNTTAVDFK